MSEKLRNSSTSENRESGNQDASLIDPSYWTQMMTSITRQLAWTVCATLTVPAILLFVIWQLQTDSESTELAGALVYGLNSIVVFLLVTVFLAKSLQADGIAERVFGWTPRLCDALMRSIRTMLWIVVPLFGLKNFVSVYSQGVYADSLGRLALMVAMFCLGISMWSSGSALVSWNLSRSDSRKQWWFYDGHLLRLVATVIPMTLVFLSAIGYCFVAEELSHRFCWTYLAAVAIMLLSGMVLRLAMGNQRRLERRLSLSESSQRKYAEELAGHSRQVVRLVYMATGVSLLAMVWGTWSDILHWRGFLDSFAIGERAITLANGESAKTPITLFHLGNAVVILGLVYIASNNLSGLLELLMPARLPLDKGGRYAVCFVMRYLLIVIGLMYAAGIIGFEWGQVQWLVAGLTVGLGFGLQEIFANLISGIIILIERPARVGDFVSVNNVTGTITQMALRATTIVDADRREWIIPNKKFITDNLMNWTLSDQVARIVVPVSVTIKCDPDAVRAMLVQIGKSHPNVLQTPEPSAVLAKFGLHTLDFELRVFVPNRNVFTNTASDLHLSIQKSLQQMGIAWGGPPLPYSNVITTDLEDREKLTNLLSVFPLPPKTVERTNKPEVVFVQRQAS